MSVSKKKKKGVTWEHSSYQCESYECASLKIRSFRITRPQISASIPSETDYPGLSQTQRIITGSPLGHCSLHAPWMEIHCWARCHRWLEGNTGYPLIHTKYTKTTDRQTFFSYSLSLVATGFCLSLHFPTTILTFLFFTPYLLYQVFLSISLSDMFSVSVKLSTPFSLSGAPISLFHPPLCFTSPLSALPLPLVAYS